VLNANQPKFFRTQASKEITYESVTRMMKLNIKSNGFLRNSLVALQCTIKDVLFWNYGRTGWSSSVSFLTQRCAI